MASLSSKSDKPKLFPLFHTLNWHTVVLCYSCYVYVALTNCDSDFSEWFFNFPVANNWLSLRSECYCAYDTDKPSIIWRRWDKVLLMSRLQVSVPTLWKTISQARNLGWKLDISENRILVIKIRGATTYCNKFCLAYRSWFHITGTISCIRNMRM